LRTGTFITTPPPPGGRGDGESPSSGGQKGCDCSAWSWWPLHRHPITTPLSGPLFQGRTPRASPRGRCGLRRSPPPPGGPRPHPWERGFRDQPETGIFSPSDFGVTTIIIIVSSQHHHWIPRPLTDGVTADQTERYFTLSSPLRSPMTRPALAPFRWRCRAPRWQPGAGGRHPPHVQRPRRADATPPPPRGPGVPPPLPRRISATRSASRWNRRRGMDPLGPVEDGGGGPWGVRRRAPTPT